MLALNLPEDPAAPVKLLFLGAHSDDIEIGCGGTILELLSSYSNVHVVWVVFSSAPEREREARTSAARFLERAATKQVMVMNFRDGFFPYEGAGIKEAFERLKNEFDPDLIFTHYRRDRHQDHRTISDLTWNTWRRHLILEYEIPKYDGDLATPNVFVPLAEDIVDQKVSLLASHFRSQAGKHWFEDELFRSLLRIRGMESASRYAEAFTCRKLRLSLS